MPVLIDIGQLATPVRGGRQGELRTIPDAALAWREGRIAWLGARGALPDDFAGEERHSAQGGLVIPGLIDCHTHLAFAGWRAEEFEQRLLGRSYSEMAEAGGGIQRTVALTRAAPEDELVERSEAHLRAMRALGVTTVEVKSGYGLDVENELKLLNVYRRLSLSQPVRLIPTLLAAHALPPEYRDRRDAYVALLCDRLIPEVAEAGLARFCDVFVETVAFSPDEARKVFARAIAHGLRPKVHADQMSDGGGAALAAEVGAISADHLEHVSSEGIHRLAASGVVAVSLPIAALFLNQPGLPARQLLDAGVPVAVATDFNPGTAPSYHLPLAMMLACTVQRMTPREVVAGATTVAAAAIGLDADIGVLEQGAVADFAVFDAPTVEHWLYHFRSNACLATWVGGIRVH